MAGEVDRVEADIDGGIEPAHDGVDIADTLNGLDLRRGVEAFIYDRNGTLVGQFEGAGVTRALDANASSQDRTVIVDFLTRLWSGVSGVFPSRPGAPVGDLVFDVELLDIQ